jgi:hypothetical protein
MTEQTREITNSNELNLKKWKYLLETAETCETLARPRTNSINASTVGTWIRSALVYVEFTVCFIEADQTTTVVAIDEIRTVARVPTRTRSALINIGSTSGISESSWTGAKEGIDQIRTVCRVIARIRSALVDLC